MTLTNSQRNLVSRALVLAADKYIGFAVDAASMAGGERLKQQFLSQATETRYIAILFGDSESVGGYHGELKEEAARITNQQFTDTKERRAQEKKGEGR